MTKYIARLSAVAALFAVPTTAAAQDCSEVLKEGAFRKESYRQNDYFKQIIYSRFIRSTYTSSKSDTDGGFGVPLGELVMGSGDYSESEYDQKKEEIQRTFLNVVEQSREINVALMTGDPEILKAWTTCVVNRGGGVTLRFVESSPTEVGATVEFLSATGTKTKLTDDIAIPKGAKVTSGKACLKKGARLKALQACPATIVLPNARATLFSSVKGGAGNAQIAYLPPRIRLWRDVRPYPFSRDCSVSNLGPEAPAAEQKRCADRLWTHAHQNDFYPKWVARLTDTQVRQGFRFDPSSATVELIHTLRYSPSGMSSCRDPYKNVSTDRLSFTYGYWNHAEPRGNDRPSQIYCIMEPSISIIRDIWIDRGTWSLPDADATHQ